MGNDAFSARTNLVIVKHPARGDVANGKEICDEVRSKLSTNKDNICIFHDATEMSSANTAYAGAFKALNKDMEGRVIEVVCAIPGSIPRMLACTVAMFTNIQWSIFKTKDEATAYLMTKGFNLQKIEDHPGAMRHANVLVCRF